MSESRTEPGPDLVEARAIVEQLAMVSDLHPADLKFLQSWQRYLDRKGAAARVGRFRLHRLRIIAETYGVKVEELARIDVGDLPLGGLDI